ncbi:hypothetical protein Snoj_15340 [Streptomyces nojiriensis]|uniref:Glutamine--fructose-6-phosphate aminotransferase [isomerizing] n=1 Tax=Streptomyces nojiriensis TaxID=66374 RepID=A0ABQ3SHL0_9ACTN|nr:SIS domain-containing protein [Streptomyces nojiriensis]QTI49243.1 Phosphoheptose isomerase [Streptomyces nojiriensis]GGS10342.1 hypothetical protein GCM10010205_44680 [Streptomyces nojiriensis]GHI67616.1 hypothetical protein Snoj_15340 [Streptomyces nojiriensis]
MYSVRTMLRQSALLAADIETLTDPLATRAGTALEALRCDDLRQVVLVGSGDSHCAGRATELAFERLAAISCHALSTQQFLDYGMLSPVRESPGTLVVAVSASGSSPRLLTAVRQARAQGHPTVAVTGRSDSAIARAAGQHVAAELTLTERCPGIRTYQASLLALLLLAVRLSALRRAHPGLPVAAEQSLVAEIAATADAVRAGHADADEPCRELAARLAETARPWVPLVVAGTGPARGTAMYTAAKVVEAAGLPAYAQDVEEYWHVERFLDPADAPLVVVAPSGRGHLRVVELARAAAGRGRRVVVVTGRDDTTMTRAAWHSVPVAPTAREEWSPLTGHVFAGLLGARLAERLDRTPFSGGGPP